MDSQLEDALKIATVHLKEQKDYKPHVHSQRCMNLLSDVIGKDEETLLETKQSVFKALAPDRIVATNKHIMIIRPSFWKLYTGHNVIGPTEVSYIPYRNLISVIATKGRVYATVHIRIQGFADESREMRKEGQISGVEIAEATIFTNFIEDIIETLAGTREENSG